MEYTTPSDRQPVRNPHGRHGRLGALAGEHAVAAIEYLVSEMSAGNDPRARVEAAKALIAIARGKS